MRERQRERHTERDRETERQREYYESEGKHGKKKGFSRFSTRKNQ